MPTLFNPVDYAVPAFVILVIMEMLWARRKAPEKYEPRDTLTSLALGTGSTVNLGTGTTSGVLQYTGTGGTLSKNFVAQGTGSDTIHNAGGGRLTLSGTLTKDGKILRLWGGSTGINVTGLTVASQAAAITSARSESCRHVTTVKSTPRRLASSIILRIVRATPLITKNVSETSTSF